MGKPIVPSGGRPPVSGSGRSLDRRGPGQLAYEEADDIGFDVVPMQIRKALRSRSLIGSQAFAADGRDPIVKRRADGTCYQTGDAWWGDETRLLVIDYHRDMEQIGERQFRPAGAWRVEGQLSRLGRRHGSPQRSHRTVSPLRISYQVRPRVLSVRNWTASRGVRTGCARPARGCCGCLRGVAHGPPLVSAVEVLVHPADGLVLGPHARKLLHVQDGQQVVESLVYNSSSCFISPGVNFTDKAATASSICAGLVAPIIGEVITGLLSIQANAT